MTKRIPASPIPPEERLTERTMIRMTPSQRDRWRRAREAMAASVGIDVDEAEFLRAAAEALAAKWGV